MSARTHGTNSCYTMGCRRPECREAHAAYQRERRTGSAKLVDATRYILWLSDHTRPDVELSLLAERTGLSMNHLRNIRSGVGDSLQEDTARKLEEAIEKWETTGEI